jgi:hypothetical protein
MTRIVIAALVWCVTALVAQTVDPEKGLVLSNDHVRME